MIRVQIQPPQSPEAARKRARRLAKAKRDRLLRLLGSLPADDTAAGPIRQEISNLDRQARRQT